MSVWSHDTSYFTEDSTKSFGLLMDWLEPFKDIGKLDYTCVSALAKLFHSYVDQLPKLEVGLVSCLRMMTKLAVKPQSSALHEGDLCNFFDNNVVRITLPSVQFNSYFWCDNSASLHNFVMTHYTHPQFHLDSYYCRVLKYNYGLIWSVECRLDWWECKSNLWNHCSSFSLNFWSNFDECVLTITINILVYILTIYYCRFFSWGVVLSDSSTRALQRRLSGRVDQNHRCMHYYIYELCHFYILCQNFEYVLYWIILTVLHLNAIKIILLKESYLLPTGL